MNIDIFHAQENDIREIIALTRYKDDPTAQTALRQYLHRSLFAWTCTIDNKIMAVWGIIMPSILFGEAYLWLLTTDVVDEHKFCFIRHSQLVLRALMKDYPCIRGHCVVGSGGIKWLKWLGAQFKPQENGIMEFELRAVA